MKVEAMREAIARATGSNFLFNDLSIGFLTEQEGEQVDGFFKEFFAFIFNSELSCDKKPLIEIRMDRFWTKQEPSDSVIMKHAVNGGHNFYQISYGTIQCEVWWNVFMANKYTALFAAGFAAYALKDGIEIQNSSYTDGAKCYEYFPTVAWLRDNRDSEEYDYILGRLYDYTMANNCIDKLLDFYDALDDMEGKAEFLNYCGRRGQFEQAEMRL